MNVNTVHFYFDESGDKGFVEPTCNTEDFGVVAGIALPTRNISRVEECLREICSSIDEKQLAKLHAVEVFRDGKNTDVRTRLFEFINQEQELLLIYEAVYPSGVVSFQAPLKACLAIDPSHDPFQDRLYNILLEGIIIKLDEMCIAENNAEVVMVTDRVDKALSKEAKKLIQHMRVTEHELKTASYNPSTKSRTDYKIISTLKGVDFTVKHIGKLEVECNPSYLSFAADTVCNSIYHHLKMKIEHRDSQYPDLHSPTTMRQHPLFNKMAFLCDGYASDIMFMPK